MTSPLPTDAHPYLAIDAVYQGDSLGLMQRVADESVHLILSDIPYGIGTAEWDVLHSNSNSAYLGSSPAQRSAGTMFSKRGKPINGWSASDRNIPKQYQDWCTEWAPDWYRVLKPGASAIVFAGRRLAHRCVCALEDAGFCFKDSLAWLRSHAPHRAQRISVVYRRRGDHSNAEKWDGWRVGNLRPIYEPILWFTKPYRIGTTIADNAIAHGIGPYNEAAFTKYADGPSNVIRSDIHKTERGQHPTQKSLRLMQALIELTTQKGQVVLDPFAGSGTTLVAAKALERRYLGFESAAQYVEACRSRLAPDLLNGI